MAISHDEVTVTGPHIMSCIFHVIKKYFNYGCFLNHGENVADSGTAPFHDLFAQTTLFIIFFVGEENDFQARCCLCPCVCVCRLVYTRVCICLCAWLRVYLCSLWRHSPFPRVCLYCGAAEALPVAVSSTQTQTPAAFTVTDLRCPLMSPLLASPWPQTHCASTNHLQFQKKKKKREETTHSYLHVFII